MSDESEYEGRVKERRYERPKPVASPSVPFAVYILAVVIAILLVVPILMQSLNFPAYVRNILSEKLGGPFTAGQIEIDLFDGPVLRLNDVSLKTANDRPVFAAKHLNIGFDPWFFLTDSIYIEAVTLVKPTIVINLESDGKLDLPGGGKGGNLKAGVKDTPVVIRKITVIGGEVHWVDKFTGKAPIKSSLKKINLQYNLNDSGIRPASLLMAGVIDEGKNVGRFKIDGIVKTVENDGVDSPTIAGNVTVEGLDTGKYWDYMSNHLPFDRVDCILNLNSRFSLNLDGQFASDGFISLEHMNIRYSRAFTESISPGVVKIDYKMSGNGERVDIARFNAGIGPLEIKGEGSALQLGSDNPSISLKLRTNDIDFNLIKKYLPDKALLEHEKEFLRNNVLDGKARLSDFSINSDIATLTDLENPESLKAFSGAVKVSNMKMAFENLKFTFDQINGEIELSRNNISFSKVQGKYGSSTLNDISGVLSDIHDKPLYNITIRADLDLAEARALYAEKITSKALKESVETIKEMKGAVSMNMRLEGEALKPVESLRISGGMDFVDVNIESDTLEVPIYNLHGRIEGSDDDLDFKNIIWRAKSSPFKLNGNLKDMFLKKPIFDITIDANIDLDDIDHIRFIQTRSPLKEKRGYADLSMRLTGTFSDFDVENRLDITNAGFRVGKFIDKRLKQKLVYTFHGEVKNRESVVIREMDITLGESSVKVGGKVGKFIRGEEIDLTFSSDGVLFDDLDEYFSFLDDIDSAGSIGGSMSIKTGLDIFPLRLGGSLTVKNADFKLPIFRGVFTEANGEFELVNDKIFLKEGAGKFDGGDFTLLGVGTLIAFPEFQLNISGENLDLIDFFKEPEETTDEPEALVYGPITEKRNYLDGLWTINLQSKSGTIGYLQYTDLDSTFEYKEKVFTIQPSTFMAHGGRWSWDAVVDIDDPEGVRIDSNIDIQDMEMERYLTEAIKTEKSLITGPINLSGKINSVGAGIAGIKKNLTGEISVNAGRGVIRKFSALSGILSLLNLSQYFKLEVPRFEKEGMPFNSVTARYILANGVAKTNDLLVDSEAIRFSAVGDYDIPGYNLDMVVAAAPFVTVDRVISSIPVAGYVLAGETKSFVASSFKVKGPINEPDIEMVPFESLAKGVIGIFRRLLALPEKAFESLSGGIDKGKKSPEKSDLP